MPMGDRRKDLQSRPMIEWIFGAVSALLVAGVIGFLAFEALFGDSRPPDLDVSIERIDKSAGGTLILVAVTNTGDKAAADVGIQARVSGPDGNAELREIRFDFVAAHSVRHGAFLVQGQDVESADVVLT